MVAMTYGNTMPTMSVAGAGTSVAVGVQEAEGRLKASLHTITSELTTNMDQLG